ncbi:MAG: hypothetical protein IAF38_04005 [Bacteroidia bacterium]|nr:hypothetical protein [Bacteroidia bacterium]
MQTFKNPFEGIIFPQYRKYKNGKNFFKIVSEKEFEEKTFLGGKTITHRFEVKILPDRNLISDLLINYAEFAEEISAEEYERA